MGKRILITGASGFIGTNLIRVLADKIGDDRYNDEDVSILTVSRTKPAGDVPWKQADIRTTDWGFLDSFKPTHVIHLAALTNHRLCADLHDSMATNVGATQRLFSKLASIGGVQKIIFPSSIVVYAEHATIPLNEDNSPIDIHHNHYSLTKGLCEELCHHFRRHPYNLPILTFRLTNIYGPHQAWQAEKYPNLIPQILTQAIKNKKIEVWNSTPVRDFLFVNDAIEAFLSGLDCPYNGTMNLASGVGTSVGGMTGEIARLTGAGIQDLGKQVSGPTHIVCDTSRAAINLGWKARTKLTDGLAKTVPFYQHVLSE